MQVIVALIALFSPRIVILLLWTLTGWFNGIFDTFIWPILGFIFLPFTLLWFSTVHNWFNGHWGALNIIILIFAILMDLTASSKAGKRIF